MGRPTTSLTDSAAPPRASPSSLVRMTPSSSRVSWKALGRGHRVLAGHGVDHQERVVGLDRRRDPAHLVHELLVDGQAPGGVDDADVAAEAPGLVAARPAATATGSVGSLKTVTPAWSPRTRSCSTAAGPLEVGPDEQRVAALLLPPAGQLGRRWSSCPSPGGRPGARRWAGARRR